jgi:hypothetical protein
LSLKNDSSKACCLKEIKSNGYADELSRGKKVNVFGLDKVY